MPVEVRIDELARFHDDDTKVPAPTVPDNGRSGGFPGQKSPAPARADGPRVIADIGAVRNKV